MTHKIRELALWKKKTIVLCTALALIILFIAVIGIAMPCGEYQYEGSFVFEAGMAQNAVIYEGISLKPGVYVVELQYTTDTDAVASCNVQDGTVFTGGLWSNGEQMYGSLGVTGYTIWLYEATSDLQVTVDYGGTGQLTTGNITFKQTNQLWTMLIAIDVFLWILICSFLVFWYYDASYSIAKEKKNVFFCVTVIGLLASVPYLCGYNIAGIDLVYHLHRIEGVKDGLLGGQFPVRIEPRWLFDHGYAAGIFYCNILLYFPAILRLLGFTVGFSYNVYCVALNLATAWIAYYCFGKMFQKRSIGVVCSALYTLSIYRIYKQLITGALGEASALIFMPLVLYGLYRIFTENPQDKKYKSAWIPVMLGYAGLMQTHVLTCEITVFVTILFFLFHIKKIFCRNTFLELFKGAVSAVLISLWFLVPFLDYYITQDVHVKNVTARSIQSRGGYLAQLAYHFWNKGSSVPSGETGMQYSYPEGVGLVLILGLCLFFVLWFCGALQKEEDTKVSFVKVIALISGVLLLMSLRSFPWDKLQSLNSVSQALVGSLEFPHRFLGWATACLVPVFGCCMQYLEKKNMHLFWGLAAAAVVSIATSGMYLNDQVNFEASYYVLYNREGMGFGFISDGEYLIQGTQANLLTFEGVAAGDGVEISGYTKNYLKASLDASNSTSKNSYVDIPLLFYKGYQAVDTATGKKLQLQYGDNYGVRVLIPAGYHGNFTVNFVPPLYWRISELVSLFAAAGIISIWLRYRRRRSC